MKNGLLPLPQDSRDFKVGAIYRLPKLNELPKDFVLDGFHIKDQRDTDMCSAFASTGMSELQEGVELSPEFSFAMGKKISGDIEAWGQNLRTASASHVKYGCIEKNEAPYSVDNKDRNFLSDPKNWVGYEEKGKKHQKQTYLKVTGVGDDGFDTIRKVIWKWRDEKRAVLIGVQWGWTSDQKIINEPVAGIGHAMYVIGWKTINGIIYLIVVNSWGNNAGDNGVHYISREVINKWEPLYGAFMFVDKPREDIEYMIQNKIKEDDNWIVQFMKVLYTLITNFMVTPTEKVKIIRDTSKILNDIADKIEPEPIFKWDTPKNVRYSCRVIMDEYNLKWAEKDLLCAVIQAESGFKTTAVNKNTNGTSDYGLVQVNTKWWIGEGKYFSSIEEVLNNPEKSVRFMVEQYKAGNLHYWCAYTNGSYKRWL